MSRIVRSGVVRGAVGGSHLGGLKRYLPVSVTLQLPTLTLHPHTRFIATHTTIDTNGPCGRRQPDMGSDGGGVKITGRGVTSCSLSTFEAGSGSDTTGLGGVVMGSGRSCSASVGGGGGVSAEGARHASTDSSQGSKADGDHGSVDAAVGARSASSDEDVTHFGFQSVAVDDKAKLVGEVFHSVADRYDVMNDLMSGSLHRLWKDEFVRMLGPVMSRKSPSPRVLDVAGGTGDIAFRIAAAMRAAPVPTPKAPEIIVCDINASMLAVGEDRAKEKGLLGPYPTMRFVEGDAQCLPIEDNSIDAYTIAFGIRNVTHVDQALRDAFRVLKPGGRFMCLEFSQLSNPFMQEVYDWYSFNIIPSVGSAVTSDRESYQYLVESIRQFPAQEEFATMIRDAGFRHVSYTNLTFGVVAIHSGFKPME